MPTADLLQHTHLAADLAALLARYLRGDATVDDILAFEGPYSLDSSLPPELRRQLSLLALIAEEVEFLDRPKADFDALAREVAEQLGPAAQPSIAAATEAAAD